MIDKIVSKFIGTKRASAVKLWTPTLLTWGTVGGIAVIHFTDWRLILDYVPYIRGKFKKDD
uniref:Ubiquinol-cytochrome c reductase, complex III subunit XI n=1 Tax=Stegastes partitus TaxID=144197 RepID=A0A3B5AHQ1_9TELE